MLTSKERAKLRGIGSTHQPVLQVGKDGLEEKVIAQIDELLFDHELIKINILKNCELSPRQVAEIICEKTGAEPVQVIGRKAVVYKRSNKKEIVHIEF